MVGTDSISTLKGIGPKTAALFSKLSVDTIEDLVNLYPRYYVTYEEPVEAAEAKVGERVAVRLTLVGPLTLHRAGKLNIVRGTGRDPSGNIQLVWYNMPYMKNNFHSGSTYIFCGTPVLKQGLSLIHI